MSDREHEGTHALEQVEVGLRWRLGHFVCRAGHFAWRLDNQIGPYALIVFPSRAVEIAQERRSAVVANRNVAMFYNPHTHYRRRLIDPAGDDCRYVALEGSTLVDIAAHHDIRYTGAELFSYARGPVRPEHRLTFDRLVRDMQAGLTDDLFVEETLIGLAGVLMADAIALSHSIPRHTPTDIRHREAAFAMEEVLSVRFRQDDTLEQLASHVGLSPYHAARLFRTFTGQTLHNYRDRLRLLASLPEIAAGERLDTVALGLGYANHAHFSDRFRRTFGMPPSAVRGALRARS